MSFVLRQMSSRTLITMYLYTFSLFSLQIKRKLPKVNRSLAARLLENDEAEAGNNETVDPDTKKKSKKKKGLTTEILKDKRFGAMFENEVLHLCTRSLFPKISYYNVLNRTHKITFQRKMIIPECC